MKATQRLKKVSTTTKVLATGNGQAYLDEVEDHLDRFLEDVRNLDAAVWDLVQESKDRLFKIVEVVSPNGNKEESAWSRLTEAWSATAKSGANLVKIAQDRAKKVQSKATKG